MLKPTKSLIDRCVMYIVQHCTLRNLPTSKIIHVFLEYPIELPSFTFRYHVFRAFKSSSAPNTNMDEVGHSRNAVRGAKNDTEDHIVESALLKV